MTAAVVLSVLSGVSLIALGRTRRHDPLRATSREAALVRNQGLWSTGSRGGVAFQIMYYSAMSDLLPAQKMGQWHVAVAAEAIAAALFARCGYDVSVQYGANQPEYDLAVIRAERMLKVSVKGSQDRGWGLTQAYLKKGTANYHEAIDEWLARHKPRTVFCFVQFIDVPLDAMPRVYLATPAEVALQLKASAGGRGETMLMEKRVWTARAKHGGKVDQIPDSWKFSPARIEELMARA